MPSRGRSRYAMAAFPATAAAMISPNTANRPIRVASMVVNTEP